MKRTYSENRLLSIGIMGIDRGEGVTALAVGLASYLQEVRCKRIVLAEMNEQGAFEQIKNTYFGKNYHEKPFEIFKIHYYPAITKSQYSKICNMDYDCIVADFGCEYQKSIEDFLRCDKKIVMGSVNLWKYQKYLEFYEYAKNFPGIEKWLFLLSGDEDDIKMIKGKHNIEVMNKKFFLNPYGISEAESMYYEAILL